MTNKQNQIKLFLFFSYIFGSFFPTNSQEPSLQVGFSNREFMETISILVNNFSNTDYYQDGKNIIKDKNVFKFTKLKNRWDKTEDNWVYTLPSNSEGKSIKIISNPDENAMIIQKDKKPIAIIAKNYLLNTYLTNILDPTQNKIDSVNM